MGVCLGDGFWPRVTVGLLCILSAVEQGRSQQYSGKMTVVFPPLTVLQVQSLIVFCSALNTTHTATVIDNSSGINFQFTLTSYGTFRRLMTSSYREKSYSVSPLTQGFHMYAKWGIAPSNSDAFSVFNDAMLDTDYVVSTWTDCCSATAFILVSSLDTASTTVTVTLPASFSGTVTANGQSHSSGFTLTLSLREVVTMTSTSDLSGTKVTGSSAILVQSGSNQAGVQGLTTGQLVETLPPLSKQGTLHFGVPSTGRSSDVYRLVSSSATNTVTIKEDSVLSVTITLTSANPVYDYVATNPVVITSSGVLLVTMYSPSVDASTIAPAMTFIPSASHWASYYVIKEVDATFARTEYVTIVVMTAYTSGVKMTYADQTQASVSGWTTFQSDATYSYASLTITQTFVLDHSNQQPFMVIQYGVQSSWAYSFIPAFTDTVNPPSTNSSASAGVPGSPSVVASSSGNNSTSDSSSHWLDDTTYQALLGVGVSVVGVTVVSFVTWRVVVLLTAKTVTSSSGAPAAIAVGQTASSQPPISSQLAPTPPPPVITETKILPKVDT